MRFSDHFNLMNNQSLQIREILLKTIGKTQSMGKRIRQIQETNAKLGGKTSTKASKSDALGGT